LDIYYLLHFSYIPKNFTVLLVRSEAVDGHEDTKETNALYISRQYITPVISLDIELLLRMISSLGEVEFDWNEIGVVMGLVPAIANERYSNSRTT
jgi:hypothetical protein